MSKQTLGATLKALIITLLLIATLVASTPPAAAASTFLVIRSVWGATTSPTVVYPGDQGAKLSIVVQNTGPDTCSAITPMLSPLGPPFRSEDGSYDQAIGTSSKTTLTVGDTAVFEFILNIDSNAYPGTYLRQLVINYRVSGIQYSTTLSITLPISQPPSFNVLQTVWGAPNSPTPAAPGEKGATLSVSIQNPAPHPIYALTGTLYLKYPFSSPTGDKTVTSSIASTLASGATATAMFTLDVDRSASIGNYQLTLKLTYLDHWYTQLTQNLTLQVYLPGKSELVITDISSTLTLGEENTIQLNIKNVGSAPAYRLSASISTASGVLIDPSRSTQNLQDLPPNSSVQFKVNATAPLNIAPGFYQAQMEISYSDAYGNLVSKRFGLSIVVRAPSPQRIEVVKASWGSVSATQPVHPGDKNVPLYVIIQNLNPYVISGVRATLNLPEAFSNVTGGSIVRASYPNPLVSGQTATLDFNINVGELAAAGLYKAFLIVSYQDPSSTLHSAESVIELPIVDPNPLQILNVIWGTLSKPEPAAPGDKAATLTLLLRNTQSYAISSIDATLHLTKPYTNITGGYAAKAYSDAAATPGNSFTLQFLLNIDEDASVGYYTLNLSLTYLDLWSTKQHQTLPVNVRLDGRSRITVTLEGERLVAGAVNRVLLVVRNEGSASATDLQISLSPPSGLLVEGGEGRWRIGGLRAGEEQLLPILLYVSPNVVAGSMLDVAVNLSYRFSDIYVFETQSIRLLVTSSSSGLLSVTPKTPYLVYGAVNNVEVLVTNTLDRAIANLTALLSSNSVSVLSDRWQSKDALQPRQSLSLNFRIRVPTNLPDTSIQMQLSLFYLYERHEAHNEVYTLTLPAKEYSSPLAVTTESSSLTAGAVNSPVISISNVGSQDVSSVEVNLSSSLGVLSIMAGSERFFFQTIPSGGGVAVKPKVFASLAPEDSLQSLTLTLSYFDHLGNWHKESRSLVFLVQGSIIISFQSVQASPSAIQARGNFTVTGNVINKGSREAYYATVSIKPNANFQAGSQYVGDIPVNTPIPFSLTVTSSRMIRNGSYPLTVVVEYEDKYGVKHSEEYTLQVNITARSVAQAAQPAVSQAQESLLRYIFIAALAAILAGGTFTLLKLYRRRRLSYAHT